MYPLFLHDICVVCYTAVQYYKMICELYFRLMDELDDISFSQSMRIIIDALIESVMEYFHITEQQLEEFTSSFVQRLPKYMQKALESGSIAI